MTICRMNFVRVGQGMRIDESDLESRLTAFRRRGGAGRDRRRVMRPCRAPRSEARSARPFGARPQVQLVVLLPLPAARAKPT